MKLLAAFGLIAPVIRLTSILVVGWLNPDYSQSRDYISELGAVGAPNAWLMNSFGIILVGIMLSGFSIVLWRVLRPGLLVAIGSVLLAAAGIAYVGVGIFPCDPGCAAEDPTITMQRHIQAGTFAMIAQTLAPIVLGGGLVLGHRHLKLGWASLGLGAVALVALSSLFLQDPSFPYPGALQKTFQVATDAWVFVSACLIRSLQNYSRFH